MTPDDRIGGERCGARISRIRVASAVTCLKMRDVDVAAEDCSLSTRQICSTPPARAVSGATVLVLTVEPCQRRCGGELGRNESRGRLHDLVGAAQLPHVGPDLRISAGSSLVTPGRLRASTSACRIHLRSVSALPMPSFPATAPIAAHSDSWFGRISATIGTARSRNSEG
jgi:hypothetical protein